MLSPDLIHDTALLTISAWQREALPTSDEAMLLLYRDQARRWEVNDNHQDHYGATLDAVHHIMGNRYERSRGT
jgi:hypothetical protein